MGCDGGTIPKRHELVKGPRKVEKVDKNAELVARWYYCALSQEKLCRPIVACELGRLYNKDAIIKFLLDKSADKTPMEAASHIKSIKNVTELNLADNPAWSGDKESIKGDKYDDIQSARFICPVVGLEMNGRHRFCFLKNCGCVFSERALKEIKSEVCHKILQVHQRLRMEKIVSIPVLGKRGRLYSPKVQITEIHLSQEKSIRLLLLLRRGPLQTARRNLRHINLFLHHTAQQNVQRKSVPIGLLTQHTISETMMSLIVTFITAFLP
ncbi:replication termination factor 2 isoform 4-T4 [Cariama cristata]